MEKRKHFGSFFRSLRSNAQNEEPKVQAQESVTQGKSDLIASLKDKLPSSVTGSLTESSSFEDIVDAISSIGAGANVTADKLLAGVKALSFEEMLRKENLKQEN